MAPSKCIGEKENEIIFDLDGDLILILSATANAPSDEVDVESSDGDSKASDTSDATNSRASDTSDESTHPASPQKERSHATPPSQLRMRVSSKHMTLVSPVFKAMLLRDDVKEGNELALPEDNALAMTHLLNIIHGFTNTIPKRIDLSCLTNIAVLVDKYELHGLASFFVDIWIEDLHPEHEESWDTSSIQSWIAIAWVFQRPEVFKRYTWIAVECNDETFRGGKSVMNLPIPDDVIEKIKSRRVLGINLLLNVFRDTIKKYETNTNCPQADITKSNACDSMVLGSIIRGAAANHMWPFPEEPFPGVSFEFVTDALLNIQITTSCDGFEWARSTSHGPLMKLEWTRLRADIKDFKKANQIELRNFKRIKTALLDA